MKLRGRVRVKVNGQVVAEGSNLVTLAGQQRVAEVFSTNDGTADEPTHLAAGDDGAAVNTAQTALQGSEVLTARSALTTVQAGREVTYTASYTHAGAAITIREMGIFTASSGGTMFARFITQDIILADTAVLDLDWKLTFGE